MRLFHPASQKHSQARSSVSHLTAFACLLVLTACGSRNTEGPFPSPASRPDATAASSAAVSVAKSAHIVIVLEENQGYSSVVDNTSEWPNLNRLIRTGALPTKYYANSHPSIGNYFMLTTGQLLTTNDNSTTMWNVNNIARQMIAHGIYFKVYAEGVGRGYTGGNTGTYLLHHNPFARLSDTAGTSSDAYRYLWPFTQFASDVADGLLPAFSFIIPDVDHDVHNGTPYEADQWLQSQVVAPISTRPAFAASGSGLLIVTFDEAATSDSAYGGGHIPSVLWGPLVKPGYRQTSSTIYQHQSLLRTIMESLNLPDPPAAAANAPPMAEFFR
jgi:phospholipase C